MAVDILEAREALKRPMHKSTYCQWIFHQVLRGNDLVSDNIEKLHNYLKPDSVEYNECRLMLREGFWRLMRWKLNDQEWKHLMNRMMGSSGQKYAYTVGWSQPRESIAFTKLLSKIKRIVFEDDELTVLMRNCLEALEK
jgi:hypothetical protein